MVYSALKESGEPRLAAVPVKTTRVYPESGDIEVHPIDPLDVDFLIDKASEWLPFVVDGEVARIPGFYSVRRRNKTTHRIPRDGSFPSPQSKGTGSKGASRTVTPNLNEVKKSSPVTSHENGDGCAKKSDLNRSKSKRDKRQRQKQRRREEHLGE